VSQCGSQDYEPARLTVQQLKQGAAAVQKDKDLPAGRIAAEFTLDQARQPVD